MSKLVTVEVNFDAFTRLKNFLDTAGNRIEMALAATVQTNRGMLFINNGAYNGHPRWKQPMFRDGQPLQDTGALRNSISPKVRNGSIVPGTPGKGGYINYSGSYELPEVTVGTEIKTADILNRGGKIVAKNAKALKIPVPKKYLQERQQRLEAEWKKEKGVKRSHSLRRRAESIQGLLYEAKQTSKKKPSARWKKLSKKVYTKKLDNKLRFMKTQEKGAIVKLGKRMNRIESINGNFIFRKSVVIPARNFTDWNSMDQAEAEITITNLIQEILEHEIGR